MTHAIRLSSRVAFSYQPAVYFLTLLFQGCLLLSTCYRLPYPPLLEMPPPNQHSFNFLTLLFFLLTFPLINISWPFDVLQQFPSSCSNFFSEPPPTAVVRPDTTNVRHVPGCRPATHSTTRRTFGFWEILQDKELGSWCVLTELSKRCLRIFITPWCLITIQISNQPQTRYNIDILLKTTISNPAQLNRLFIICCLVYIYETPTTTTVIQ